MSARSHGSGERVAGYPVEEDAVEVGGAGEGVRVRREDAVDEPHVLEVRRVELRLVEDRVGEVGALVVPTADRVSTRARVSCHVRACVHACVSCGVSVPPNRTSKSAR